MKITKQFSFEAAHNLPWHQGKCQNLHGHSYKLFVTLEGALNSNGVVMDFGDLSKIVEDEIIEKYDHKNLNDFFENPTCENMVMSFLTSLGSKLYAIEGSQRLKKIIIKLYETEKCFAEEEMYLSL